MNRLISLAATAMALVPTLALATPSTQNAPLMQGPPITMIVSPYDAALTCLSGKLTADQKRVTYAVGAFPDRTGKVNYAAPEASGSFLGQGYEDALITSLTKTGVQVVDTSAAYKQQFDWSVSRARLRSYSMKLPDVQVTGSFNSADIQPGGGWELTGPVELGTRQNRMIIGFDARATAMPLNAFAQSGQVLTTFAYVKQLVGYENKAGITTFFGGGSTRSLIGFNLGKQGREALQYAGRTMMDVVAYRTVRDITGQTGCDETFRLAETVAVSK